MSTARAFATWVNMAAGFLLLVTGHVGIAIGVFAASTVWQIMLVAEAS